MYHPSGRRRSLREVLAATDWNEWVGIGTLALAGVTFLLAAVSAWGVRVASQSARDTRRLAATSEEEVRAILQQADAAREEVAVSREALQATICPPSR
jgi:hypothetical protein